MCYVECVMLTCSNNKQIKNFNLKIQFKKKIEMTQPKNSLSNTFVRRFFSVAETEPTESDEARENFCSEAESIESDQSSGRK